MREKTLHMIGNGHLDPVWLWQWQEGFQALKATFRSALDRMRECDDFIFTGSSAAFYAWIEQNDPAMFREIAARVAEGRWRIVGGWWIQPDCNLPCGESFVRQGLYGQRYFREKFGVTATVGYNPDSFGHHGMLPQILRKSGMDRYVFMRPAPGEKGLPGGLFWWESDDGSRVLTYRIPFEYCTPGDDIEQHVRRCLAELPPHGELMCFYGVGNHGGGPTRENIASIQRLDADPAFPALRFSAPDCFFAAIERRVAEGLALPVVHDDLQHHASGCYSAHSGIKAWNRRAENLLVAAEKWSALADRVTGQPYPADFRRAWTGVLFNQFHDILAGTSIEPAYDDARDLYGEANAIAGRALNDAIQSLAWQIAIPFEEGMTPIVVFNPHAWASKMDVEVEFGRLVEGAVLLDERGERVPLQQVTSLATVRGASRTRLCFVADLPALGYRTYRVVPRPAEPALPALRADDRTLENDHFRLTIDPETGGIASLYDKRHAVEVFAGEAARAVVIADESDTWSHGVTAFNEVIGQFAPHRLRLIERGPVKATLRVESAYDASTLYQDFTLYRDLDRIDVRVTVDWQERRRLLKLRFPVNLDFVRATYEIPYGHIERETNGEEEPGQSWLDLSGAVPGGGPLYGLSLLNDAKYSFDVTGREIGLTVLRSPIYAHHVPRVPEPDGWFTYIDQGRQSFTYALLPHAGGWREAGTVRRAAELNQRPIALVETYHDGPLPQADSYVAVDADNIVVAALKQAEDGDDLIVRAYETAGRPTAATICLPRWDRTIAATFGPCEIKTFRAPREPEEAIVETDLIEWTLQG